MMDMATLPGGRSITASSFEERLLADADQCDLSRLVFVDAFGVVATACALLAAGSEGTRPGVVLPTAEQMHEHLGRMGFIRFLSDLGYDVSAGSEPEVHGDVVVPLRRVANIADGEQLSHLMWAQAKRWVSPQVLQALTEGLWELVANALEHSGAEAVLMGQVYRHGKPPDHDDRVQIVIGDVGRGIRESFLGSGTRSPADDREAIELALEYLVSSVPDPGRGQGLTTTVEEVTALTGSVVIRSGAARVEARAGGLSAQAVLPIKGTMVGMSLPLYPG